MTLNDQLDLKQLVEAEEKKKARRRLSMGSAFNKRDSSQDKMSVKYQSVSANNSFEAEGDTSGNASSASVQFSENNQITVIEQDRGGRRRRTVSRRSSSSRPYVLSLIN